MPPGTPDFDASGGNDAGSRAKDAGVRVNDAGERGNLAGGCGIVEGGRGNVGGSGANLGGQDFFLAVRLGNRVARSSDTDPAEGMPVLAPYWALA